MNNWHFPYFTTEEMGCRCGCGVLPTHEFMSWLVKCREQAGFAFIVTSGARCENYDMRVSHGRSGGAHVERVACDIAVYGLRAYRLLSIFLDNKATGIGLKQIGPHEGRFIHGDLLTTPGTTERPRPSIWTYS